MTPDDIISIILIFVIFIAIMTRIILRHIRMQNAMNTLQPEALSELFRQENERRIQGKYGTAGTFIGLGAGIIVGTFIFYTFCYDAAVAMSTSDNTKVAMSAADSGKVITTIPMSDGEGVVTIKSAPESNSFIRKASPLKAAIMIGMTLLFGGFGAILGRYFYHRLYRCR